MPNKHHVLVGAWATFGKIDQVGNARGKLIKTKCTAFHFTLFWVKWQEENEVCIFLLQKRLFA
ncbi:MAG: hypothetical protein RID53_28210 [Coleofasciculus sp. B1-GNL1-01]|uniref:hypothetical protein n=1 Tax=Coleofasciculus sp. B1-GNL1-01 TaxID=3068484 RepID=UPI0032FB74F3